MPVIDKQESKITPGTLSDRRKHMQRPPDRRNGRSSPLRPSCYATNFHECAAKSRVKESWLNLYETVRAAIILGNMVECLTNIQQIRVRPMVLHERQRPNRDSIRADDARIHVRGA